MNTNNNDFEYGYGNIKKEFPDSLISFLPKNLNDHLVDFRLLWPAGMKVFNSFFILIEKDLNSVEIEKLPKSLIITDFNNEDLLIVNGKEDYNKTKGENFSKLIPPVPNFGFLNYYHLDTIPDINACKLSLDYEIHIIDGEPGIFYHPIPENEELPEYWENGYSRGYAINKKKKSILYWIIIW